MKKEQNNVKELLIIDGNWFYARYYFTQMSHEKGISVAVRNLERLLYENEVNKVVVVFDDSNEKRKDVYSKYKSQRKKKDETYRLMMNKFNQAVKAKGIYTIQMLGQESDDVIASLCKKFTSIQKSVFSGDRDMYQLVDKNTNVISPGDKGLNVVDFENFKDKVGLNLEDYKEYKILIGDSSDNIPGLCSITSEKAKDFVEEYGTYDNFLDEVSNREKKTKWQLMLMSEKSKKKYELNKFLITLNKNISISGSVSSYSVPFKYKNKRA